MPNLNANASLATNVGRIVITGIGGFVGAYAAEYFHSRGFEVWGFDRRGSAIPNASTRQIDILDRKAVGEYIKEIRPGHILHLAAQSSVKESWERPEHTRDIIVRGTANILETAGTYVAGCRIVVVSSSEVYGIPISLPVTEKSQLNPINPYAKSRVEQEKLCQEYAQKYNLDIVIVRSFPHTGPGQSESFVCSGFAKQLAMVEAGRQEAIIRVGNLDAQRDFTDVRDVVHAYFLLLCQRSLKETDERITSEKIDRNQVRSRRYDKNGDVSVGIPIFNVCSGQARKIAWIMSYLQSLSQMRVVLEKDPQRIRPSDIPIVLGSYARLAETIGWNPEIPLERTLGEMWEWWREHI